MELARQKERGGKKDVLFPVRLDSAILDTPLWASFIQEKRDIGSFEHWEKASVYNREFRALLSALRKDS